MKKAILIIAIGICGSATFAQNAETKTNLQSKKEIKHNITEGDSKTQLASPMSVDQQKVRSAATSSTKATPVKMDAKQQRPGAISTKKKAIVSKGGKKLNVHGQPASVQQKSVKSELKK